MLGYLKFVALMSTFHICRGVVNAFTTLGAVAVSHATPLVTVWPEQMRTRVDEAYHNKNQEWN